MSEMARIFIIIGVVFIVIGISLGLLEKIPGLGRLPGDILIKKENFTFYFPLATCILLSLILSLIFYLWTRK